MHTTRVLYVLAVLTALSLWVLWQAALLKQTGYRVEKLNRHVDECKAEIDKYKVQISKLEGPTRVVPLVEKLDLHLVPLVPEPQSVPTDDEEEHSKNSEHDVAED